MSEPLTLTCGACGNPCLIGPNNLARWSALCAACRKARRSRPRVRVTCKDCGKSWTKLRELIPSWQGRCNSCAQKLNKSDPDLRARMAAAGRAQIQAQGVPCCPPERHARGARVNTWKGGITPEHQRIRNSEEHRDWARAVKERDNFTCQDCGRRRGPLASHHLRDFAHHPESRFDVANGITLCNACHARRHGRERGGLNRPASSEASRSG